MRVLLGVLAAFVLTSPVLGQEPRVLDAFEDLSPWAADASTDVSSDIAPVDGREGRAMRLSYDFNGRSGYAFAARPIDLNVPENFEISFWARGDMRPNTLEIKFVDATGRNVHWRRIENFQAPSEWTRFTIKKRQITWAWGPDPDRTFRGAERIEFVVTAGQGGAGTLEVDQLEIRELPPEPGVPPRPVASTTSEEARFPASQAVDGDLSTVWRSEYGVFQNLTLDLGYEREFGGVTLRWTDDGWAGRYRLEVSNDGADWDTIASVDHGNAGVDWLRTPEASGRYLRLSLLDGAESYGLREIEIEPLSFGETPTKFVMAVAEESLRGLYPRGFVGEQPYWTLVGVDGGGESGLMSEDGAIELRRGGPSIEPFVVDNGRLITWADVGVEQSLRDDDLPIPTVMWTHDEWTLAVTGFAEGTPDRAQLYGRYVLTNTSLRPRTLTLALAARPFQVNGPVQFLAVPGGVGPIEQIDWNGSALVLNDAIRVSALVAPNAVAVSTFESGADPQSLIADAEARRDPAERIVESDASALMAGALIYDVTLQPGERRTFGFVARLSGPTPDLPPTGAVEVVLDAAEDRVAAEWRGKMDRFDLILPPEAQRIEDVAKSSLAHMLMSRQGPIIQPGTRSYNRSWIRDGAMMAEGLNRLGHADVSSAYLDWYAPYVFEDGKVPCCVDARGSDPVPENDSHGEFIFLAAENYRHTRDVEALRRVWPQVQKAIAYMDGLRATTRTAEFRTPETAHLFGLLPPTISHEGYSDNPAYSYWDDFWGLIGYRDAAFIADVLGETDAAARIRAAGTDFQTDVMASITATAAFHDIDWIAGAADRGDFDATSTTIGLSPGGFIDELPQPLLNNTFDKWWDNFTARQENRTTWRDYTPYELRNVGALIRLGRREEALRALDFYFADMRPVAWNGWAEVVGRHEREPRFIGDMPHAWISSDYIRSAIDLLVYERVDDGVLVLAAGLPFEWMASETGVGVRDLRTAHGALSWLLKRDGAAWTLSFTGAASPSGGFELHWPEDQPVPARVRIDDRAAEWDGHVLRIPANARRVEMR
ncbi:MAG: discoidin domain-containing protein [Caulobacteraceae bacterium]|nr:discoidin domain-containing protein [Caulobacteraceae bacterium]